MGVSCKNLLPRKFLFPSRVLWEEDGGDTLLLTTWYLQSKCTDGYNPNPSKCTLGEVENQEFFLLSNASREVFSTDSSVNPPSL